MKSTLKLCYPNIKNFGDELNGVLFKILFGVDFVKTDLAKNADILAVGSSLNHFILSSNKKAALKQIFHFGSNLNFNQKITVIGTGFMELPKTSKPYFFRKMDFRVVRGVMTKEYLMKANLATNKCLVGDLGLLTSLMYNNNIVKKYQLGIIPHLDDFDSPFFFSIYKQFSPEAILINVKDSPEIVTAQIRSCHRIISSSLHGLIVADSYGIPNLWMENRFKRISKPNFKFHDYYSSILSSEMKPTPVSEIETGFDLNRIDKEYKIDQEIVQRLIGELYQNCLEFLPILSS